MKKSNCLIAPILITLLLAGLTPGCRSTRAPADPAAEKSAIIRRAKAPQVFGLTAYTSDNGAVFAGAFRQYRNHIGRIDFVSARNSTAPVIGVGEEKVPMLIDSASAESWIGLSAARALGATALAGPDLFEKRARHVQDDTGGFAVILPSLKLEKAHVANPLFYARNPPGTLSGLNRWLDNPLPLAILGADFLRSFEFVTISLRGRRAVFSGTSVYPYAANALARIPVVNLQGGLGVACQIDGEPATALLDIAGDFAVAIDQASSATIRQVTIGDVVFRQVDAVPAPDLEHGGKSPPRLGRQLLERYDLVINRRGTELLLEKPSR